jgi:precorrin-6A synthase
VTEPERDRGSHHTSPEYVQAVADWHQARADALAAALGDELAEDGCGAFLVWGDPGLYDSTLRVLDRIASQQLIEFEVEVIPGISSVQALAATHRIPLNRIGEPILITTGRRLRDYGPILPPGLDNVIVMLDSQCSFQALDPSGIDIYWGAYLGTPDEVLVAGKLAEVADEISRIRATARARKGWIMDTYLLRRTS